MHPEIQKLLDHCSEFATELLTETGESYPFAAWLDTIGNVHPMELEFDKKNVPNIGNAVEQLRKFCENEMTQNKIRGYAVCYEVKYVLVPDGESKAAIAIDSKHCEEAAPIFYLPFEKASEMSVGELFAVKK